MKFFLHFVLVFLLINPFYAYADFERLFCEVRGYFPGSFDIVNWGDHYRIEGVLWAIERSNQIREGVQFEIPRSSCQFDQDASLKGVFHCTSSTPGRVLLSNKMSRYDSVALKVSYRQYSNDYPPFQALWPLWHQRFISVQFSGGDFREIHESMLSVNVNFYNAKDPAFQEKCLLDDQLITK
jgi:hypothetical protein